ncbi:MAG: AAA family ATPase [Bacteroidales bacterium]|nr:AAA family ATPase [Bacteroidales bacterium]MBR3713623.1 AAA family ATPase [Bacteroidales bacterium]MBR4272220.1 AAA family ATPase [Bacteroidales bacterium]MBR4327331.1 AAA family ATPase [Bacteroidales bacterium]
MLNYPLSIQSFEDLRKRKCVYVDKTDYVYNLAYHGKTYFLARPRRFGKSLLCNTLRSFFEGKKELFEGLKIYDLEKDWIKYPILYIPLASGNFAKEGILYKRLSNCLEKYEKTYLGVVNSEEDLGIRLQQDVEEVLEKTGLQTVMIVDEYDNPLINSTHLEEDKQTYRGFFTVLKDYDECFRFVFLTGVTRYAKTTIFSGNNQPNDITFDKMYSGICGITHDELRDYFTNEIKEFAKTQKVSFVEMLSELIKWYDCYLFNKKGIKVFNPVSLFNALSKKDLGNYWYDTGTPTILMKRIKNTVFDITKLKNDIEIGEDELEHYKDDELTTDIVPLLYYSGYLTIKNFIDEERLYILGFPDYEVETSFFKSLARYFYGSPDSETGFKYSKFLSDFRTGDVESVIERMKALFCALPYAHDKSLKFVERDFQNVIYLVFSILGEYIISEAHLSKGRADSILINKEYVYIFEFKIDQDAQTALNQINVKNYAGRFKMDDRKIVKVGVSFSSDEKNIVDWKAEF